MSSHGIIYKPLGELEDALESTERPHKVFYHNNMGNRTFLIRLPIYDFYRMSDIASEQNTSLSSGEISQRPLDMNHASKLANFILKGLVYAVIERAKKKSNDLLDNYAKIKDLLGQQPYIALQPLVCNLRNCERDGNDLKARPLMDQAISGSQEIVAHEVLLSQQHIFWVIDGQHRRKAIQLVFEFLDHVISTHMYPNRKAIYPITSQSVSLEELDLWRECNEMARSTCSIAAEVHLGLSPDEERQLFHDLNNLAKKVEAGLALEFDRGNPINTFIQDQLIGEVLEWKVAKKDISNWQDDDGSITRKDLTSINTRLILNKTNPRGATPAIVTPRIPLAIEFWQAVQKIPHLGQAGAKNHTVAAQPVVLKALAKLAFDFAFGKAKKKRPDLLDRLLQGIPHLDFGHNNPMWRYYTLTQEQIDEYKLEDLAQYLPDDSAQGADYNRDIGGYDHKTGMMRFGAKHNDIYPILGDMIRWKLNLPSRHEKL